MDYLLTQSTVRWRFESVQIQNQKWAWLETFKLSAKAAQDTVLVVENSLCLVLDSFRCIWFGISIDLLSVDIIMRVSPLDI